MIATSQKFKDDAKISHVDIVMHINARHEFERSNANLSNFVSMRLSTTISTDGMF